MRATPLLTASLALLLVPRCWSDDKMGLTVQMTQQQIADRITQAAMQAAAEAGFPPDKAAKYIKERLTDRILGDKTLDPSSGQGVNQQQLDAAVKYVQTFPSLFKLMREVKNDPDNRQARQQLEELRGQEMTLLGQTGPLQHDLLPDPDHGHDNDGNHDHDHGPAPAPPSGNEPSTPFGPALGNMMQGASDYKAGDYNGAVENYTKALSGDPKNADALSGRSSARYHLDQYDAAYGDAKAALALNPRDENAMAVMHFSADRLSGGGDAPAASAAARAASSKLGAGLGPGEQGRGGASVGSAGLLASGGAGRLAAQQSAAQAQNALKLGDLSLAAAAIARGLEADPGNSRLLGLRAQLEARRGEYAKSLADAQAALAADPKNIALLRAKALAQLRTKDYAGAIATANEMFELDPNSADAYALRAQAYGLQGRSDMMLADLESAAAIDPLYRALAERAKAGTLVAPKDSDVLFLMPDEGGAASAAPAPADTTRRFGLMLAVAAAGGLLLALGLLRTFFAPLKDGASAALSRLTRTGPHVGTLEEDVAEPALPGLIRGQYEVAREIGAGGMGRVYEGTDRSLNRRVAIKKMRDELRADPRERARFVSEAKTVAALHHPSIVDIYAIAEEGPDVYLIFEYVDGKTVHELVHEVGRLEPAAAAGIVRAAAEALEFAHARGVIHRDMKPSNVMVDSAGRVKVMDFGIARAAKDALSRYSVTNTVVGTPPYMAPEQEQGQVRRESDVYALAICAYEMLSGDLPFAGTGSGMMLNKINRVFEPLSRRVPGLPSALDAVFARALDPNPDKRWRTPREFSDALAAALPAAARA